MEWLNENKSIMAKEMSGQFSNVFALLVCLESLRSSRKFYWTCWEVYNMAFDRDYFRLAMLAD